MADQIIASRYILRAVLGRGGFGEVWLAQDAVLGRPIAVNVVDVTAITSAPQLPNIVARFRREALAVGGLRHPNIVSAYDAGQDGDTLYLVMELVPGGSLADLTDDRQERGLGPLPVAEVLDIAEQVCAGLASAHSADVVHRDIKRRVAGGVSPPGYSTAESPNQAAPGLTSLEPHPKSLVLGSLRERSVYSDWPLKPYYSTISRVSRIYYERVGADG